MSQSQYTYNYRQEEEFILLLGCWTNPAPHLALPLREDTEYRQKLQKYIKVNGGRTDSLGRHGCKFASLELSILDNKLRRR
jgi:hypothetical protein